MKVRVLILPCSPSVIHIYFTFYDARKRLLWTFSPGISPLVILEFSTVYARSSKSASTCSGGQFRDFLLHVAPRMKLFYLCMDGLRGLLVSIHQIASTAYA